jgi:crotonobetainyl-CoA:carnitine CoA-transferase CaiB-like acyl-CoA transferase
MLAGLRVLEYGDDAAVRFCGWMLARNGASVTRNGGSGDSPEDTFLGAGKSIDSDAVLRTWDIILCHCSNSGAARGIATGVLGVVDDYAPEGPYRDWHGVPITQVSHGGAAQYTRSSLGEPVYGFGHIFEYLAGLYLFASIVAAHSSRIPAGRVTSTEVRVSKFETIVSSLPYLTTQVEYNGSTSVFGQSGPRFVSVCRDGWVVVYAGGAWANVAALLGEVGLLTDPRFGELSARFAHVTDLRRIVAGWTATRTVAEACQAGMTCSVAIAPVRSVREVLKDAELRSSGFLSSLPDADELLGPNLPYVVQATGPIVCATSVAATTSAEQPLAGVRVLDLSHVWSGPHATRLLAALGAEVIKVENPAHPDVLRGKPGDLVSRYPDFKPTGDFLNRNAWFNTQNTDKQSLVVDLKDPRGRALILDVAATCDVVLANYRAGVLDRMGLGFEVLQGCRPDVVLVEMPGHMPESRSATRPAYGAQFEAESGACFLVGDDSEPLLTGFALGDPCAGMFAVAAAVSALDHRRRMGQGSHIRLAQAECLVTMLGDYIVAASAGRPTAERINGAAKQSPHGIFHCRDENAWIALAVQDEAQWRALVPLLGPEVGAHLSMRDFAWALEHEEEVHQRVAAWARDVADVAATCRELQSRGIPSAPVANGTQLVGDQQLSSGYFAVLDHPSAGTHRYPGFPLTVNGRHIVPTKPAPLLGEHSAAIAGRLAGLGAEDIAVLVRKGVLDVVTTDSMARVLAHLSGGES